MHTSLIRKKVRRSEPIAENKCKSLNQFKRWKIKPVLWYRHRRKQLGIQMTKGSKSAIVPWYAREEGTRGAHRWAWRQDPAWKYSKHQTRKPPRSHGSTSRLSDLPNHWNFSWNTRPRTVVPPVKWTVNGVRNKKTHLYSKRCTNRRAKVERASSAHLYPFLPLLWSKAESPWLPWPLIFPPLEGNQFWWRILDAVLWAPVSAASSKKARQQPPQRYRSVVKWMWQHRLQMYHIAGLRMLEQRMIDSNQKQWNRKHKLAAR